MEWRKVLGNGRTVTDADGYDFSNVEGAHEAVLKTEKVYIGIQADQRLAMTCCKRFDQSAGGTIMLGYVLRIYVDKPTDFALFLSGNHTLLISSRHGSYYTDPASPLVVKEFSSTPQKPLQIYFNENQITDTIGE